MDRIVQDDDDCESSEELSDENLISAVTRCFEIMIGESIGKPRVRSWPEFATDRWSIDFIKKIVEASTQHFDEGIPALLGSKCETRVARKIYEVWEKDKNEQAIFWTELSRFVRMNTPMTDEKQPALVYEINDVKGRLKKLESEVKRMLEYVADLESDDEFMISKVKE